MAARLILCLTFVLHLLVGLRGQNSSCRPTVSDDPLSPRIANYVMDVRLDTETKMVYGTSIIQWTNTSPDTVRDMHMYLYLNAFANAKTSLLGNPGGSFGQDLSGRESIEWGGLTLSDIRQQGSQLDVLTSFVYPDEENFNDSSAVRLELPKRVLPGESTILTMSFQSKLPLIIGRSGYAENDFYHVVHWYPKVGVYEQDLSGDWGWNCHQFLPGMEFYGDFGNYDVTMNVPSDMVVGASGCLAEKSEEGDRCTYRYVAEDVIDFAWCASPDLEVVEDSWGHVDLRLLSAPAHHMLRERLMNAAKSALSYLDTHIGAYPYRTLTILDPPMHGLRSGFMEYPTYITGGAFTGWPKGVRTVESLVIHELTHQYFMQMLANNEKEEPWMDEGFVTYYEDRIMEHAYGSHSLFDLWGYRVSNQA
ncbi:MAG: M1 family metallopeptidase, partial [Bacteroidota bacterium]